MVPPCLSAFCWQAFFVFALVVVRSLSAAGFAIQLITERRLQMTDQKENTSVLESICPMRLLNGQSGVKEDSPDFKWTPTCSGDWSVKEKYKSESHVVDWRGF